MKKIYTYSYFIITLTTFFCYSAIISDVPTPLMLASYNGQFSTVKNLLAHGVNVNEKRYLTTVGTVVTALDCANILKANLEKTIKLLKLWNAKTAEQIIKKPNSSIPLIDAAKKGNVPMILALVNSVDGLEKINYINLIKIQEPYSSALTALDAAQKQLDNCEKIINFLKEKGAITLFKL